MAKIRLVSLERCIKNLNRLWRSHVAGVRANLCFIADRHSHPARRWCLDKTNEVHGSDRPLCLDHRLALPFGKLLGHQYDNIQLDLRTDPCNVIF